MEEQIRNNEGMNDEKAHDKHECCGHEHHHEDHCCHHDHHHEEDSEEYDDL